MQVVDELPLVSVIIATRNRTESLKRCLDSLAALDYPRYEVIIVDNAPSTASTHEMVMAYMGPRPIRYVLEERPGLAIAHNTGALMAYGDILAFTDDDVQVQPDWLDELVAGFRLMADVGCVTGAIVPAELETEAQSLLEEFGGYHKGDDVLVFDMGPNRPDTQLFPYSAGMFGGGANMAFTRDAITKIGGFDPALGAGARAMGGDDLAAFFDVVTRGLTLVYAPRAVVRHWHRRDAEGLKRMVYGYGVGLTAYLTRVILDRPQRLLEILPKIPRALKHVLDPRSQKNKKKSGGYPRQLTWLERAGMARGPFAYLSSLMATRSARSDRWLAFGDEWLARGGWVEGDGEDRGIA